MEIKKCERCGSFFTSENDVCNSCLNKDRYEKTLLKSYFDENVGFNSVHAVSEETGISPRIIENYLLENNLDNPVTVENTVFYNQIPY